MTHIRKHIRDHLDDEDYSVSEFNLRCLVGMLETGEATLADFVAVGGHQLAKKVLDKQTAILNAIRGDAT